ncbi:hypothetical protein P692DRAFT_20755306, partial [Suillus brevipes Sb2]
QLNLAPSRSALGSQHSRRPGGTIETGVGSRFGDTEYATGHYSQVTLIDNNVNGCTYVTVLFDDRS